MDGHPVPQGMDRTPPTGRLTVITDCHAVVGTTIYYAHATHDPLEWIADTLDQMRRERRGPG